MSGDRAGPARGAETGRRRGQDRDAAAIDIINLLIEEEADVRFFDPFAAATAKRLMPDWQVTYCEDEHDAARGSDGVIVVTEWKRFRDLNMSRLRDEMRADERGPVLIDGRNLFDATEMKRVGFRYHGIGRGKVRGNGAQKSAASAEKNGRTTKSAR